MASNTSIVASTGHTLVTQGNIYKNSIILSLQRGTEKSKSSEDPNVLYKCTKNTFPIFPLIVDKRERDVECLRKLMSEHHKVIITGIAGLGKTTLAKLCAQKWVEDGTYQNAIFVDVETEEKAQPVYEKLAKILFGTENYSNYNVQDIYERLQSSSIINQSNHKISSSINTLFIFDNIDEDRVFNNYYPRQEFANIDILSTSQFSEWRGVCFYPYPLPELSKEESFKLVMAIFNKNKVSTTDDTNPVIYDLVYKLGYHPLALQYAAAHIADNSRNELMSVEKTICKYKEDFVKQLKEELPMDQPSEYRKTVYAALSSNIEIATISKEHIKSLLLYCMTYLDPSDINIEIFYKAFTENDVRGSLRQLKKYSVIFVVRDKITMNRLVPVVCHAMLTADEKIKCFSKLLNIFFKHADCHTFITRHCSFLIEHFEKYFDINKEGLAALYQVAFNRHNNITKPLTVISDTEGWSIEQSRLFFYSVLKFYNRSKKEPNQQIFKNITMLSICCAFGMDNDYLNELIDTGCDVNIKENTADNNILWAAKHMSYDIVFTLLRHGAKNERWWWEKLLSAADAGYNKSVLRLLEAKTTGEYRKMFLWWAAGNGHHDFLRELIQRGTDTSGANARGNTLLHMVARGGYDETVSQFITAAGNVNITNSDGDTALIFAAQCGHDKIVSELIEAEADVNLANNKGETPLSWAQRNKDDKMKHIISSKRRRLN